MVLPAYILRKRSNGLVESDFHAAIIRNSLQNGACSFRHAAQTEKSKNLLSLNKKGAARCAALTLLRRSLSLLG
jgi:hypothetical protein